MSPSFRRGPPRRFRVADVRRWLGSLHLAVPLLVLIAAVLAWGTLYETRFGTAAVQRFVYRAWWFQLLLGFLAANLAAAALERRPWKRQHAPFLMAHLGIILILIGGILGGRFAIEGQLIIPEGEAQHSLQLPTNVLLVQEPNPGIQYAFPTQFETTAWVHEPHAQFEVPLHGRTVQLLVDRYYPDAEALEEVRPDGPTENPAVRVTLRHNDQHDEAWLFAREPERFGLRWGEAHVLFLEPSSQAQLEGWLGAASSSHAPRGVVSVRFSDDTTAHDLAVPERLGRPMPIAGTPYAVTFKDYFPDFTLTEHGPASRSEAPNNPAVALTLSGPEGVDAYLRFALHPDFDVLHGRSHTIPAQVSYTHPRASALPPDTIAIIRRPDGGALSAVMTGAAGQRNVVNPVDVGHPYTHPSLGYQFQIEEQVPRAQLVQRFTNRSDNVRMEAVHVTAHDGRTTAQAWVGLRDTAHLTFGKDVMSVDYAPAQRELPFTVQLIDFRKITYPGIDMAAAFESDVQLIDAQRGVILTRTIKMNHPLRYRGFSLFQASYVPGEIETTVLAVRSDPGTPFVYAGFLIVMAGVVVMFVAPSTPPRRRIPRGAHS